MIQHTVSHFIALLLSSVKSQSDLFIEEENDIEKDYAELAMKEVKKKFKNSSKANKTGVEIAQHVSV